MLTSHHLPASLSFISTDLPILSTIETAAILYQKDRQQFHLVLNQPGINPNGDESADAGHSSQQRLLWLEISPGRVVLTLQGTGKFACRHFWARGVYGLSRYWLNGTENRPDSGFCLQNFTRSLQLEGDPLLRRLRLEYELWTGQLQLGHYILHLEIYH
jgi:hypothetical protein